MTATAYPALKAKKPYGGFRFLLVQQLCLVWWAYHSRRIQLIDLRVWFAAHEMVARRCQLGPEQVPDYTSQELHGLIGGVGGEHLRASLHRLEALGLLTWSSTHLTFATSLTHLRGVDDVTNVHAMLQAIPNHARRVPVPRQTIRLIAGGLKASVIATMMGHLIRCLYYREHRCRSGGWCKASWIAEVFGMDLRSIKAARKHLVEMGWLLAFPTPQRLCNRWGLYALISLSWMRTALKQTAADCAAPPSSVSPPPSELPTTGLPPLHKEYREPFQEFVHQQPALQAEPTRPAMSLQPPVPTPRDTTGTKQQGEEHEHVSPPPSNSPAHRT